MSNDDTVTTQQGEMHMTAEEIQYRARRLETIQRRRRMNSLARRMGYRNYAEYCEA